MTQTLAQMNVETPFGRDATLWEIFYHWKCACAKRYDRRRVVGWTVQEGATVEDKGWRVYDD
jgi:hypothetical protein